MYNNEPLVIAIIGAGFSGTMVAVNLLKRATRPLIIKIIEPKKHIGLGVAYSTGKICHLLNVPAGKMSAFADDSEHFLRWLHNQGFSEVDATTFVPRLVFGQYIKATLEEALFNAPSQVKLEHLETEAVSLSTANKVTVTTKSGEIIQSDRVVLALGNFPSGNPRIDDPSFYESKRYINWAWSNNWLDKLSIDEPVLLIGSGLTALDMVLSLHQQGHKGKIYMVSRRGLQPQVHQSAPSYSYFLSEPPKTIRALVHAVRQEINLAASQGYDWRPVIDSLRPYTQVIWKNLSISEKRRFLRHARIYWDVHRHRVAPEVAQIFTKLSDSGQVISFSGRIQAYSEEVSGVNVTIRKRYSNEPETIQVGFVVNCTSPQSDYRRIQHPLIQQLLNEELILPHPLIGLDAAANGALINATGQSEQLYTLGSPQIGYLWETIAVPEVRVQAEALAIELLK